MELLLLQDQVSKDVIIALKDQENVIRVWKRNMVVVQIMLPQLQDQTWLVAKIIVSFDIDGHIIVYLKISKKCRINQYQNKNKTFVVNKIIIVLLLLFLC